ncbi:MAG: fumarate hydratase [Alphaproteobacteria bacterium]|nr:fumarate hydratase [Alphaproteobacteria bacterium]
MLFPDPVSFRSVATADAVEYKNGFLSVPARVFENMAFEAFKDVSHFLRPAHLQQLRNVFDDRETSANERFAALEFLKNANIASGGVLPLCQDTGTAIVIGEKGHLVLTDGEEAEAIAKGIKRAYAALNLRYSQNIPLSVFDERNSGTNLPAQIDLTVAKGNEYRFLFMAKGGGSANKTFLFQQTRALLNKKDLTAFLTDKIAEIGVSACPPYHLAIVIGGLSAEMNVKTVKLASAKALDALPASENGLRDTELEAELLRRINENGLGAQFGGRHFCLDVRVIRLPRHGASLPIGIGVSCIADRNILGKITPQGAFLEQLETDPAHYLPAVNEDSLTSSGLTVDLNRPIGETLRDLDRLNVGDRLFLNGTLIVARDIAHARFKQLLERGKPLPDYLKRYPIYYAGPAKKPNGKPSGSFGPTTAGRMDSYVGLFQKNGASLIMLAKGNRSAAVTQACQDNGGFYLGTLGGAAAQTADSYITDCRCIDFEDLGMEAVWQITVKDFPAFLLTDNKGNDFYKRILRK